MVRLFAGKVNCDWLREVHLGHHDNVPVFKSYVLYGNEDAPERAELYADEEPEIDDTPVAVYVADDEGNLQRLSFVRI